MDREAYEQVYGRDEFYWGTEANGFAATTLEYAPDRDDLRVVDVGAGEGRDAVLFAEAGCAVTAIDTAAAGLEKATSLAAERGVDVETRVDDVNDVELADPVDVLYSIGTIQHLRPENRGAQFSHFKARTRPDGVHALFAFVDHPDVPTPPDWGPTEHFYDPGEVATYYDDWECVFETAFTFPDDSGGEPHEHACEEYVFRKP